MAVRGYPDDWSVVNTRALVLLRLGRFEEALAEARRSDALVQEPVPQARAANAVIVVMALARAGRIDEARAEQRRLEGLHREEVVTSQLATLL